MKNYTNLSVMKSSEAESLETYKEESVEESQFETKKPYLFKGYEVPKNAQMLKFRYYTPENTLIEQNNVPYVYDGTSITDVINYYYLSDSNTAPIFDYSSWKTDGWTKEAQTVTAKKRYLWCITETRFSNTPEGVCGNLTGITLSSVYGEQGERGAIYLGHYVDSQACYEDNKPAVFTGDYYLNTKDSYIYVYDEESNLWAKITDFSDYRYNQSINDIFEAIESSTQKETFIKAKKIWVQNIAAAVARTETLFSNKITLTQGTDLDGNTTGGIIQSENYKSGNAGWKIDYNGNAEFNNATVRGKIYATEGEFKGTIAGGTIKIGENFSVDSNGNVTMKNGLFDGKVSFDVMNFSHIYSVNDTKRTDGTEFKNGDVWLVSC